MPRCRETKPDGTPCERIVGASRDYCYAHDPDKAEERKRNAARGGRNRGNRRLLELDKQLADLAAGLLSDDAEKRVDRGVAAVVNQIINTRARLLELERKIKEAEDFEARIEALERTSEGGRRWGA